MAARIGIGSRGMRANLARLEQRYSTESRRRGNIEMGSGVALRYDLNRPAASSARKSR
jgi:hypothetical protein